MLWPKILRHKAQSLLRSGRADTEAVFGRMYRCELKGEIRAGVTHEALQDAKSVLEVLPPFIQLPDNRLPPMVQVHALPLSGLHLPGAPEALLYLSAAKSVIALRPCLDGFKTGVGIWQHIPNASFTVGAWTDFGPSRLWVLLTHAIIGTHLYTSMGHLLLVHQEWMDDHESTDVDIVDLFTRYWTHFGADGAYFGIHQAHLRGHSRAARGPFGGWGPAHFGGVPICHSRKRNSYVEFVADDEAVGRASPFGAMLNNVGAMLSGVGHDWQTLAALPEGTAPRVLKLGGSLTRSISDRITEQTD